MTNDQKPTRVKNAADIKTVQNQARAMLPPRVVEAIEAACAGEEPASELIHVLHTLQGEIGYLDQPRMDAVAQLLQVPAATVSGVATFYHFFRLGKAGRFAISVCMGTACYVKGADKVLGKLRDELGIDFGETTTDGLFSLAQARCLGMCGLAPVVMVNKDVYENVTFDQVPMILENYTRQARSTPSV